MQCPVYSPELNRGIDIDAIVHEITRKVIDLDYDRRNSQIVELDFESVHFEIEVIKNPDYIEVTKVWMSTEDTEKLDDIECLIMNELTLLLEAYSMMERQLFKQAEDIRNERHF